MKKILLILFLLFFLTRVQKVGSQDSFQDYLFSTSKYKSDYEKFVLAKSKYLTYKSLASEIEAIDKTEAMLLSRIELVKNYLNLIRGKFATETGIGDYKENLTYIQLDNQITDVLSLKDKIIICQTLSELDRVDLEFEKKYILSQRLSFKTLGLINIHKFSNFTDFFSKQVGLLKEKVKEIENLPDYETAPLLRKLDDVEKKLEFLQNEFSINSKTFFEKVDSPEPKQALDEFTNSLLDLKGEIIPLFSVVQEVINLIKKI